MKFYRIFIWFSLLLFGCATPKGTDRGPTSIDVAVETFNQKAQTDLIGRTQAPLTTDEVVAAINRWDRQKHPVADDVFEQFKWMAKTRSFPRGAELTSITKLRSGDAEFLVWWIDLGFRNYSYRIRATTIKRISHEDLLREL